MHGCLVILRSATLLLYYLSAWESSSSDNFVAKYSHVLKNGYHKSHQDILIIDTQILERIMSCCIFSLQETFFDLHFDQKEFLLTLLHKSKNVLIKVIVV